MIEVRDWGYRIGFRKNCYWNSFMPKCHFCDDPAEYGCTWPVKAFIPVPVLEIREGEIVRRAVENKKTSSVAVMLRRRTAARGRINVYLKITDKSGKQRLKAFTCNPGDRLRAEREGLCGTFCCEKHHVDRGEGIVHCRNHWHAWEQVA